jgi:hypothetical protein
MSEETRSVYPPTARAHGWADDAADALVTDEFEAGGWRRRRCGGGAGVLAVPAGVKGTLAHSY